VQERNGKPPEAAAPDTRTETAAPDKPAEAASLLAFPTAFPIKIMGRRESGFATAVIEIVLRHAPDFMPGTLESRPSREGKYISLTATVNATSREQLDALYRELCDHPSVVMVL
jgi:putative lipoic acid-binding regulatory protein